MYKTAECVSPAHPDKLCDQISDMILDACLEQDKESRVAIETMGGHGEIYVCGELTTRADVDITKCVTQVLKDNRYTEPYKLLTNIMEQSPDIARGVDTGGAGDQGIMVGYATNENPAKIPMELYLARKILKALWDYNLDCRDAKSQVTMLDGAVTAIVLSAERIPAKALQIFLEHVILPDLTIHPTFQMFCNPAGDWDNGGFNADTGLTGRKLAVDNYGPQIEIGGGCFSGKDYTKVDRSGAYMARSIACHFLKLNDQFTDCKVKLAYSIGVAQPVMVSIN